MLGFAPLYSFKYFLRQPTLNDTPDLTSRACFSLCMCTEVDHVMVGGVSVMTSSWRCKKSTKNTAKQTTITFYWRRWLFIVSRTHRDRQTDRQTERRKRRHRRMDGERRKCDAVAVQCIPASVNVARCAHIATGCSAKKLCAYTVWACRTEV